MSAGPSVQLYTLREALADDLPGTLDRLAGLGFTQVEPFALVAKAGALGPALAAARLAAPTAHQSSWGSPISTRSSPRQRSSGSAR